MRVLRVHSWDGPVLGGGERYILQANAGLARRGHEVKNVVLTTSPLRESDGWTDTVRVAVPERHALWDMRSRPEVLAPLRGAVREFAPDLLHLHHFDAGFASLARFAGESTGLPWVFTAHDAELVCPISTLVLPGGAICEGGIRWRCQFTGCSVGWGVPYDIDQRRVFDRSVAPRIRRYICPSRAIQGYLDAHRYRPTVHLPPFVPDAHGDPPQPHTGVRVGFLGRAEPYKGLDRLADAIVGLGRGWTLVVAAAPNAYLESIALRIRAGGGEVELRGEVLGAAAKREFFSGIDLLAVPSQTWENLGLVVLESFHHGVPVLATRLGGLPEAVGPGGVLVPHGSTVAVAEGLRSMSSDLPTWRERVHSPEMLRHLSEFSEGTHLDRLVAVYREVVEGRSAAPGTAVEER